MSSEAITRNDLSAILNGVIHGKPSEYRKLLWENPSLSSFAPQTISLNLTGFDKVSVEWAHNINTPAAIAERFFNECLIGESSDLFITRIDSWLTQMRSFSATTNGVTFGDCKLGSNATVYNNHCVPVRIYGINYERVQPPQVEFEWEEITPLTVTVTTGSSGQQLHAYRRGRMLFFSLSNISRAANTSAGSNFWVADVSGLPASFINSVGCAYYDEKSIFVHFQSTSETTAKLTARVTGGTLNANSAVGSITTMTLFSS